MEKEISPFPDWIVWHALISPEACFYGKQTLPPLERIYRIRLVIQNEGWLPTYVTKKALERKLTRGLIAEISLPKGASLQAGKEREELGELEGRAYKAAIADEAEESTNERVKVEWVVKAKKGTKVKLTAKHDRAGTVRTEVVLK